MPASLKERLREFIDHSTGLLGIVGFGSLTCISLALPDLNARTLPAFLAQFHSVDDAITFFSPRIAPLLLILTTIYWYYRYRGAVINELNLINDAFEESHAPRRVGSLDSYRLIPFIGYALVGTFIILILLAPYITLYCIGALVLHSIDLIGNLLTLQNLNKMLSKFPVTTDAVGHFLRDRREVLKEYYFGHPTLPRIGITFLVTASILVLSSEFPPRYRWLQYLYYGLVICNILTSELIMTIWRNQRDRKLDEIAFREEEAVSLPS
jgi:hypothetical protein